MVVSRSTFRLAVLGGLLAVSVACVRDQMNEAVHPLPPEAGSQMVPVPVAGTGKAPTPIQVQAPARGAARAQPIPGIAPGGSDPQARLPPGVSGHGDEAPPPSAPSAPSAGGLGGYGDAPKAAPSKADGGVPLPSGGPLPVLSKLTGMAGGIRWRVPEGWIPGAERPMRAATYTIPAVAGDREAAECAVFFFGSGQGGDVQANLDRWIGQFRQPDGTPSARRAVTEKAAVAGFTVTRIRLTGTYTASMGGFAAAGPEKPGFALLGAIVQGPDAPVFFKLTGPAATVEAAGAAFDELLGSLK